MVKNLFRVLVSNLWVVIVGVLNAFAFPKIMTYEHYAYFQTFNLYITYVGMLHLGFPTGMFINYGGKNYKSIAKETYKSEIFLLIYILAFFTVLGVIIFFITGNNMVLYVTISILPLNFIVAYKSLFQAWSQFKIYSILNIAVPTSILIINLAYYFLSGGLSGVEKVEIHLLVYVSIATCLALIFIKEVKNTNGYKKFTRSNYLTLKIGFIIAVGNFINVLFSNIDKQFIKIFFGDFDFAIYSFSISMQAIMTVFIIAVSQSIYPYLAKKEFSKEQLATIKEFLIVIGSLTMTAYFACSLFIHLFIPKYTDSLKIIAVYFTVFPAMAIINSLYINFYKINKMTKKYVLTLSKVLIISIVLNTIAIIISDKLVSITISTALTYYIWLFYSGSHFDDIKINKIDILYLSVSLAIYFLFVFIATDIYSIILFPIIIFIYSINLYKETYKNIKKIFISKI